MDLARVQSCRLLALCGLSPHVTGAVALCEVGLWRHQRVPHEDDLTSPTSSNYPRFLVCGFVMDAASTATLEKLQSSTTTTCEDKNNGNSDKDLIQMEQ
ncbi:hypothetical protein ZWY2020_046885 [Hordeum vulgare]|nr:hypothetical protein ZWY2020_059521 [Hordeum vulgare]KAI5006937.1 hypothetical protein ZWY2020_046885 [Hordeum vulgare]